MAAGYTGPIVDVDVHNRPRSESELVEYLPKPWREFVQADPHARGVLGPPTVSGGTLLHNAARRADSYGADGSPPGSTYQMVREQLLDRYNYFRLVLTHDFGDYAMHLNPYFAIAMCSAANDWIVERWLAVDERLTALAVVPLATPDVAADEVRRVGGNAQIVGVLLVGSPLGRPLGDPVYHPVYEAAAEMGLSLSIHQVASERPKVTGRATPAPFMTQIETIGQQAQQAQNHISSFVVHGVFEKFPSLHLLVKEYGVAWLPSLIWRLDEQYELLRIESPWVKRWPSDYIREFVKLSTQPIETGAKPHALADLLESVDGLEDLLCFSTDYPHISFDDPNYVVRQLPRGWARKVMCTNACDVYGWRPPADDYRPTVEAAVA